MSVEFKDYTVEVKKGLNDKAIAFLHEAKSSIASQTSKLTPVDSGALKRSFQNDSMVDESEKVAYIGSSLKYAPYVELGTGEYALNGNGRKGGWFYEKDGKLHFTRGQAPKRMLYHAFQIKKGRIKERARSIFKEL